MEAILQSPLGQTILEPGEVTIGSTPDSRLVVHDVRVSPHHAVLRPTEQGYTIADWHSTDGTFVNEQRLEPLVPRLLTAGDQIRLGETVFTYEVHEGTALVPTQVSRPENEPAVLVAPTEHMTYGADAQAPSAPLAQTGYGSVPQQGYAPASQQQPGVPPDVRGAMTASSVAPPPPYTPPPLQKKPPTKGGLWKMPRRWRLLALIALIILLVGGSATFLISWLPGVLPAATANVTITPASLHLTKSYTISAVTGTPDAAQNQTQARVLSFTTKAQSKTVKATGQGHQDATKATGKVVITAYGEMTSGDWHITSNSGINVTFTIDRDISSGTHTFPAHADDPGAKGNIPAYNLYADWAWQDNPSQVLFHSDNPQAFTGGQDAHNYTFVQQNDIDGAATPLVNQLTSDAQTAVQQQAHTNEQFAGSPNCTPNIKANHKANDSATAVTVTVTVTCNGVVYDPQAARSMAADLLRSDAATQPGAHYALIGDTVIGTPLVATTDEQSTVTLNVSAEGIWVYQFSDAQKQHIAQLIAGKTLSDARAILLKQEGIRLFHFATNGGWGRALPTSPNDITFTVAPVPGLQAQATTQPTAQPTTQPSTQPTQPGGNTIGKAVQVGNTWVVTVNNVKTSPGSEFTKPKSGNIFIVVDVSVKNISSSDQSVSSLLMFNLKNATGQLYTEAFTEFTNPPDGTVTPNSLLRGQLVYEVPSKDHTFTFSFQSDSTGSDLTTWNVNV
jgi:pSer/pThr/pTyr-binding forkhead associated (FHA) protein